MKYQYTRQMTVDVHQNPTIQDIEAAIALLRKKASEEFGSEWDSSVHVISYGSMYPLTDSAPSMVLKAEPKK